jgi:hypothetical protein
MNILDALLPIAATAAGHFVKQSAVKSADKKRAAVMREMGAMNNDAMRKQVAVTDQQVQQYQPQQRMPALDRAEQQAVQRLTSDVTAPSAAIAGPVYGGKVSDAYSDAKARRAADELRYATRLASLQGKAAAPADLALQESFNNMDGSLQRAGIRSDLRGAMGVRELQMNSIEPSGGMMMAGDMLQGAGMAMGTPAPQGYPMFGAGAAPVSAPSMMPGSVVPGAASTKFGTRGNAVPGRRTGVSQPSLGSSLRQGGFS